MKKLWLVLVLAGLVCGCSMVPFEKPTFYLAEGVDPQEVLVRHQELSPETFKMINTVVFQYRTRKFLSLGYLAVDVNAKAFDLVAMNPVGIKLIELSAKNKDVIVNNVIDEISKRGDLTKVLVEDIDRIYFDAVPLSTETVRKTKRQISVSKKGEGSVTKYVFSGKENDLVKKVHYEGKKKSWSVGYYEYFMEGGKRYPRGIVFTNHLYKYKLIITAKEVL